MPQRTYRVPRRRIVKRNSSKLTKPRLWAKTRAVSEFSRYIRERDARCMYPNCTVVGIENLQNSHYIGRALNATTYDPENCIALCKYHHYGSKLLGYEYQKQRKELHGYDGQYTIFMRRLLGPKKFKDLCTRGTTSVNGQTAILKLMLLLNKL